MRQQELEQELKTAHVDAIGAYTHWLYNADSDFVAKAWKADPHLAKHLQEKLMGLISKKDDGCIMYVEILVSFDRELSQNNREILYAYIIENHSNKW
jgi:hypothetical protein